MAKTPAILAVHLLDRERGPVRAGNLVRDSDGSVTFTVSETYLRNTERPILSLGWYDPEADDGTRDRLADRGDKIGLRGFAPPPGSKACFRRARCAILCSRKWGPATMTISTS